VRRKIQVQLVLSLMESKTRPRVAESLFKMRRNADHVPADLVDKADLFDGGGQVCLAKLDGLFNGALSWMNVQRFPLVSNNGAARWYEDFACLAESEHLGDVVSALEYGKYEFVGEIQEGGVCFGLRLLACATLAVDVKNHADTIQEKDGNCVSYVCCGLLWRRLCCYQVRFVVSSSEVLFGDEGKRKGCWLRGECVAVSGEVAIGSGL